MSATSTLHIAFSGPTAELVNVTPATAEAWLSKNLLNRREKPSKIESFARDMQAGRWAVTGEAIKFSTDGALLDGQNRLRAVIVSGATVPMFVVRGIQSSAQEVMDSGTPRSTADALHLRGYANTKDLSAAVNCLVAWKGGAYKNAMDPWTRPVTHREALAVVEQHPLLPDSVRAASVLRKALSLPRGAVAVAHYELVQVDADDAAEFFARITDLRTEGRGDPVHTLIRRAAEMHDRRERIHPSTALFLMFRAWNACRNGEDLLKFQLGSPLRGWVPIPVPA